jgi:hypothetical protein
MGSGASKKGKGWEGPLSIESLDLVKRVLLLIAGQM